MDSSNTNNPAFQPPNNQLVSTQLQYTVRAVNPRVMTPGAISMLTLCASTESRLLSECMRYPLRQPEAPNTNRPAVVPTNSSYKTNQLNKSNATCSQAQRMMGRATWTVTLLHQPVHSILKVPDLLPASLLHHFCTLNVSKAFSCTQSI